MAKEAETKVAAAATEVKTPTTFRLPPTQETSHNFKKSWNKVTRNSNRFQRYTTLHLLNLRFLEEELARMEDQVLRAGLKLAERKKGPPNITFEKFDVDNNVCDSDGNVSQEFVEKLRGLIQQYDDALIAFNDVKGMETILLNGPRDHLVGLEERYNGPWVEEMLYTRLVKPQSSNTEDNDIIRRFLRKVFVRITIFFRKTPEIPTEDTEQGKDLKTSSASSPARIGNSKAISIPVEFITRLILALVSGALLITPLTLLSFQSTRKAHLITVSVSTVIFALLVSLVSKSSNSEIMAAAAGYTAVLVVFFAVAPQSYS